MRLDECFRGIGHARNERQGQGDIADDVLLVDQAIVTDAQNCGNMLAGVGPFAIERGLMRATGDETRVAIFMENTGQIAIATVQTPGGIVRYDGDARIDGVPGSSAPIPLEFRDTACSSCGALLPTGNAYDEVEGIRVTLIDNAQTALSREICLYHAEDEVQSVTEPMLIEVQDE